MRNAVLLCLCALPLLCGCTPALRGGLAFAGGDYELALQRYNEALAANPDSVTIRRRIGITYFTMKNYAKAETAFKEVLARAPGDPRADFYLGLSIVGKGEVTKGLDRLATFSWPGKFERGKYVRDEAELLLRHPGHPPEEIIRRIRNALKQGRIEEEQNKHDLQFDIHDHR